MTALDPLDLDLLYFLCSASHHRCRVVRVKAMRLASLGRLREAGFVGADDFEPSAPAIADWLAQRACAETQTDRKCLSETPARGPSPELAEPPAPKAVAKGGGRARSAGTPSPKPRRDPTEAPPAYSPEKQQFLSGQAARLRAGRAKAAAFLDSGKTSLDAGNVSLRIEARKLEVWRAEEARRNDPLEQAKTLIRCKTRYPVFAAEVSIGEKGKGKFFIGNKLVSKRELLAMAKRLAA